MRTGRWIAALCLISACVLLPGNRAGSQEKTQPDDPPVKKKKGEDPKPADAGLTELKKGLEAAQQELKATKEKLTAAEKAAAEATGKASKAEAAATAAAAAAKAAADKLEPIAKSVEPLTKAAKEAEEAKFSPKDTAESITALKKDVAATKDAVPAAKDAAQTWADTAWMLTSSALVMLMVPGLALFYCGMVRRKNVLATMMQSMACLAVVGLYWVGVGYSLAFGPSVLKFGDGGIVGWSWDLVFLQGIAADKLLPNAKMSVYTHAMFQGMFAIITPALISGAIAERIRFWPFCIFVILWVTFVYCPLAHMVWAFDWYYDVPTTAGKGLGETAVGYFGKMGALDFAGGTVVHIAAGLAGLACVLVLRKRAGYPDQVAHPNSMVLTVLGAGLLWFGWFGFNGGSSGAANPLAASAFAATQVAAAAAGLTWMVVECLVKGKPTGLGLASGIVAGLVAVTPASGYVYVYGAVAIGVIAAVVCYAAVALKNKLGYDDSLDAFGVHGVGGFVGAILTGLFCSAAVNSAGADGYFSIKYQEGRIAKLEAGDKKLITEAKAKADELTKAAEAKEAELKPKKDLVASLEEKLAEAKKGGEPKAAEAAALDEQLAAAKKDAEEFEKKDVAEVKTPAEYAAKKAKALEDELDALTAAKKKRAEDKKGPLTQFVIQVKASVFALVYALVLSLGLALLTQAMTGGNFTTTPKEEADGLDRTEHGEVGFDFGYATESVSVIPTVPRAASAPPGNGRFDIQVAGAEPDELMKVWSGLAQPSADPADPDFLAVYPHVTTIRGSTFRCRGGEPAAVSTRLTALFQKHLGKPVTAVKVG